MRVLIVTADPLFKKGNPRYELQAQAVEYFEVMYWGRSSLIPKISEKAFDVVSTQDPFIRGLVGWCLARRFKAQFNVQVHAELSAQNRIRQMIAYFVMRRADTIRVVSEKIKNELVQRGIQAPIHVLPVFIELERFQNIERHLDTKPLILWVGRFEEEKDPMRALTVFREVFGRMPNAHMIMLGSGTLQSELRSKAGDLPVEFPGWTDPVPYLARAHVVLSTSREESYGASIIEALAAGVPVIAPNVGVAKEAGAIVVDRGALVDVVIKVLQDPPQVTLSIPVFSKEEWLDRWERTLI